MTERPDIERVHMRKNDMNTPTKGFNMNGWTKVIGGLVGALIGVGVYVATLNHYGEQIKINRDSVCGNARDIVQLKIDMAEMKVYLKRLPEVEKKLDVLVERSK